MANSIQTVLKIGYGAFKREYRIVKDTALEDGLWVDRFSVVSFNKSNNGGSTHKCNSLEEAESYFATYTTPIIEQVENA